MTALKKLIIGLGVAIVSIPTLVFANITPASTGTNSYNFTSPVVTNTVPFTGTIIEYNQTASADDIVEFKIRFMDKGNFTEWVKIEADIDGSPSSKVNSLINSNETTQYQYTISTVAGPDSIKPKIENIEFDFINAEGEESIVASVVSFASTSTTRSNRLRLISRAQWGAKDEYNYAKSGSSSSSSEDKESSKKDDPEIQKVISKQDGNDLLWPFEYMKNVRMIVIHHTASTNNLDDPKQAIRNIQYYHAVSRGWGDIGYNFIIDQKGNIYEGRGGGPKVVGGHALAVNKTSIGIAVLGNFEDQKVPKAVTQGLVRLIQQQANLYDLDVKDEVKYNSKTYPVVGGHRDNAATSCPGANLYKLIPSIRALAASTKSDSDDKNSSSEKVDFSYEDLDSLREAVELSTNKTVKVDIKIKNTGKKTWNRSNTFLRTLNPNEYLGGVLTGSQNTNIAGLKESSVAPGKTGTFTLQLTGGLNSGSYSIDAQPVLNGTTKNILPLYIPIEVKGVEYKYEIVGSKSINLKLKKGESKNVTVTFKNSSDFDWNSPNRMVKLGMWSPKDGMSQLLSGGTRVGDFGTKIVKPGQTVKLTLKVKAPNVDTTITESYAPVIDGVSWFEKGTPFTIKAVVGTGKTTFKPVKKNSRVSVNTSISDSSKAVELASVNTDTANKSSDELGPIFRVLISVFNLNSAEVSPNKASRILVDNKEVAKLKVNQKVEFIRNKDLVNVKVGTKTYSGSVVRLVSSSTGNINTVHNFKNSPAWNNKLNDNQYRGNLEFRVIDSKLNMINELPLEHYLRGIGEVSNSSPDEKNKTIMVAARSYAYNYLGREKFKGMPYNLDDSPDRSQKYIGYGFEKRSPKVIKSVTETAGEIITYNKKSVVIPYFNQSDGRTRSGKEVWGWNDTPYLVSVKDPYCKTATKLLGHGVGISGCGATGMAEAGFNYKEIIKYYLTGVEITKVYGKK